MSSRHRATGRVSGRLMQRVLVLATALLLFSFASTSHAYPWMIRHGFTKCENCHTDPMGGETLTAFGRVMSQEMLSTKWGNGAPSSASELFFGVAEPQELRVGGSIRVMDLDYRLPKDGKPGKNSTFPMQADAYGQLTLFDHLKIGGSLGVSRTTGGRLEARAAQITDGNADGDWNAVSRTHWIGYQINDAFMVRAGRMNLPFGIRMSEHTMLVRDATHTDRESSQEYGAALDFNKGRIRGQLMGIAGNYAVSPDDFRNRGYALYAEYMLSPHAAVGISSLVTHAKVDRYYGVPTTRIAQGLTGRWAVAEPVVILAEADLLASDQTTTGYVGMLQADYEIIQGLHLQLTGETVNRGRLSNTTSITGQGKSQFGGWVTLAWFFFTHFDARVDFNAEQGGQNQILSQVHWYF
ncbi:MAG TPA: hypothetical protein VH062_22295 [Polyangiaceae bacterium]|jgi:hypothetical protein|nr:hypothetical protein [Polyangiaceae bacterium]